MHEHEDALAVRFRMLGCFRALSLHMYYPARYAVTSDDPARYMLENAVKGVRTVSSSLGVPVDSAALFPALDQGDKLTSFLLDSVTTRDAVRDYLKDQYGERLAHNFSIAQVVSVVYSLGEYFSKIDLRQAPRGERREMFRDQREEAFALIQVVGETMTQARNELAEEFGARFRDHLGPLLGTITGMPFTRAGFEAVRDAALPLVGMMVPHFADIMERVDRGRALLAALRECREGNAQWNRYEDICIKLLRLLVLPPFRTVMTQSRTADGHERRDAVLPNNQFSGFWNLIRQEFDARHIICEFKNRRTIEKNDLNQLRIYLGKPTIGRFGLLFYRGTPTESSLLAQRNAYEQARVLVLLVNDALAEELVFARAFLGSIDSVLEEQKARFEIEY